jgi:hypothetical protein
MKAAVAILLGSGILAVSLGYWLDAPLIVKISIGISLGIFSGVMAGVVLARD